TKPVPATRVPKAWSTRGRESKADGDDKASRHRRLSSWSRTSLPRSGESRRNDRFQKQSVVHDGGLNGISGKMVPVPATLSDRPLKPLFRGRLHQVATFVALPAGLLLAWHAGRVGGRVGALID